MNMQDCHVPCDEWDGVVKKKKRRDSHFSQDCLKIA